MAGRDPLKDRPLRNPGDSLEQQIQRWSDDRLLKPASGFGVLALGDWVGQSDPRSVGALGTPGFHRAREPEHLLKTDARLAAFHCRASFDRNSRNKQHESLPWE